MARVLREFGKGLHLLDGVLAGLLHQAGDFEPLGIEMHFGIDLVIAIVRKSLKRNHVAVSEGLCPMMLPEERSRSAIAEADAVAQELVLKLGNGEYPERHHGGEPQQLSARDGPPAARSVLRGVLFRHSLRVRFPGGKQVTNLCGYRLSAERLQRKGREGAQRKTHPSRSSGWGTRRSGL